MVDCYHKAFTRSKKTAPCDHAALREGRHTQCCEPGDLCLTNGLCREETVNETSNYAWRFGCTDETFRDPACATQYCDSKPETQGQDLKLTWKCHEEDIWCCNTGEPMSQESRTNRSNTTCCTMENLLFKAAAPKVYATASFFGSAFSIGTLFPSSTPVSNATGSAGFATTPTTSSSGVPAPASSNPSTLAIGLGAGLGSAAAIALGIASFCLWRRRKRNKVTPRSSTTAKELSDQGLTEVSDAERAEMVAAERRTELTSPVSPAELWSPSDAQRLELPVGEKGALGTRELSAGEEKGRLVIAELDGRPRN
ncbi:hypothetical protein FB567DRAFT_548206 [Paraphoma chrysanthemicola]|uniref:Uncharacterized protein n=1 Tax=Paraphoma chrysanthemicola TaxID=798071 RepID=A0A8K0R5F6_9PLEO|nr:hypothetical protein FB567DRAFT_548206 [Paraphoma chrysanthemicola]